METVVETEASGSVDSGGIDAELERASADLSAIEARRSCLEKELHREEQNAWHRQRGKAEGHRLAEAQLQREAQHEIDHAKAAHERERGELSRQLEHRMISKQLKSVSLEVRLLQRKRAKAEAEQRHLSHQQYSARAAADAKRLVVCKAQNKEGRADQRGMAIAELQNQHGHNLVRGWSKELAAEMLGKTLDAIASRESGRLDDLSVARLQAQLNLQQRRQNTDTEGLVICDGEGKLITMDGRTAVSGDPTGANFPWVPRTKEEATATLAQRKTVHFAETVLSTQLAAPAVERSIPPSKVEGVRPLDKGSKTTQRQQQQQQQQQRGKSPRPDSSVSAQLHAHKRTVAERTRRASVLRAREAQRGEDHAMVPSDLRADLRAARAPDLSTGWSLEDDKLLEEAVSVHGPRAWSAIACGLPRRSAKECRLRWLEQQAKPKGAPGSGGGGGRRTGHRASSSAQLVVPDLELLSAFLAEHALGLSLDDTSSAAAEATAAERKIWAAAISGPLQGVLRKLFDAGSGPAAAAAPDRRGSGSSGGNVVGRHRFERGPLRQQAWQAPAGDGDRAGGAELLMDVASIARRLQHSQATEASPPSLPMMMTVCRAVAGAVIQLFHQRALVGTSEASVRSQMYRRVAALVQCEDPRVWWGRRRRSVFAAQVADRLTAERLRSRIHK
jgi:hypothetical protein